jgi:hypothetical protein
MAEYFHYSARSHRWLSDLSKLIGPMSRSEEKITSILFTLSAAVSTGSTLPPTIETPKPYQLSENLIGLDPEVLHIKNIQELGFSAYTAIEIISTMLTYRIIDLIKTTEKLVRVARFEFVETDWDENERARKTD